jgi:hypothetical protein
MSFLHHEHCNCHLYVDFEQENRVRVHCHTHGSAADPGRVVAVKTCISQTQDSGIAIVNVELPGCGVQVIKLNGRGQVPQQVYGKLARLDCGPRPLLEFPDFIGYADLKCRRCHSADPFSYLRLLSWELDAASEEFLALLFCPRCQVQSVVRFNASADARGGACRHKNWFARAA